MFTTKFSFLAFLMLMILCIVRSPSSVFVHVATAERAFLYNLYSSTQGSNWALRCRDSWDNFFASDQQDPCTVRLEGVQCTANGNVTSIDLSNCGLAGTLPSSLWRLGFLSALRLSHNQIGGSLPASWMSMDSLFELYLNENQLTGSLPPEWGNGMLSLEAISLGSNRLTGSLPEAWRNWTDRILRVNLTSNTFEGSLPFQWATWSEVITLVLDVNRLTGTIPPSWFHVSSNLRYLGLSYNRLSGVIPVTIGTLPALQLLSLAYNQLTGTIPNTLPSTLTTLHLHGNQLSGTIPGFAWNNLQRLTDLSLYDNNLTGTIPSSSQWTQIPLAYIYLGGNQLTGTLPEPWGGATESLEVFHAQQNLLTGTLPGTWKRFLSLRRVYLSDNQLNGTLPDLWSAINPLALVQIENNQITGTLPDSWGGLAKLFNVRFSNNQLNGTLPAAWQPSVMTAMTALVLSQNLLNGEVPPVWSGWTLMRDFRLAENNLTGTFPVTFFDGWNSLEILRLQRNQFSGPLPVFKSPSSRTIFVDLRLYDNLFEGSLLLHYGSLPALQVLLLHQNKLNGTLPGSWSALGPTLQRLQINQNKLTGTLPSSWSAFTSLIGLQLQYNFLTGTLPESWGTAGWKGLERLDLHFNQLEGTLPERWEFQNLQFFDLSVNMLSGSLPVTWQYQLPALVKGDPDACNPVCNGTFGKNGRCYVEPEDRVMCLPIRLWFNCFVDVPLPAVAADAEWTWSFVGGLDARSQRGRYQNCPAFTHTASMSSSPTASVEGSTSLSQSLTPALSSSVPSTSLSVTNAATQKSFSDDSSATPTNTRGSPSHSLSHETASRSAESTPTASLCPDQRSILWASARDAANLSTSTSTTTMPPPPPPAMQRMGLSVREVVPLQRSNTDLHQNRSGLFSLATGTQCASFTGQIDDVLGKSCFLFRLRIPDAEDNDGGLNGYVFSGVVRIVVTDSRNPFLEELRNLTIVPLVPEDSAEMILSLCVTSEQRASVGFQLGGVRNTLLMFGVVVELRCGADPTQRTSTCGWVTLYPTVLVHDEARRLSSTQVIVRSSSVGRLQPAIQRLGGGGCDAESSGSDGSDWNWLDWRIGDPVEDSRDTRDKAGALVSLVFVLSMVYLGLVGGGTCMGVICGTWNSWAEAFVETHPQSLWVPFASLVVVPLTSLSVEVLLTPGGSSAEPVLIAVLVLCGTVVGLWGSTLWVGVTAKRILVVLPVIRSGHDERHTRVPTSRAAHLLRSLWWYTLPDRTWTVPLQPDAEENASLVQSSASTAAASSPSTAMGSSSLSSSSSFSWERAARFKKAYQLHLGDVTAWWYNSVDIGFSLLTAIVNACCNAWPSATGCYFSTALSAVLLTMQWCLIWRWRPVSALIPWWYLMCSFFFATVAGWLQLALVLRTQSESSSSGKEEVRSLQVVIATLVLMTSGVTYVKYCLDAMALLVAVFRFLNWQAVASLFYNRRGERKQREKEIRPAVRRVTPPTDQEQVSKNSTLRSGMPRAIGTTPPRRSEDDAVATTTAQTVRTERACSSDEWPSPDIVQRRRRAEDDEEEKETSRSEEGQLPLRAVGLREWSPSSSSPAPPPVSLNPLQEVYYNHNNQNHDHHVQRVRQPTETMRSTTAAGGGEPLESLKAARKSRMTRSHSSNRRQ